MNGFKEIGVFENDKDCGDDSWSVLLGKLLEKEGKPLSEDTLKMIDNLVNDSNLSDENSKKLSTKALTKALSNDHFRNLFG